jgi:hypothetical protein
MQTLASLNPQHVTTQIDSASAIGKHKIHVLKHEIYSNKDHRRGKADPNPSRLGKSVLHEFKHKVKLKITRGNLMNLLDVAKI